MNNTAVFPGSFDPFTLGHKDIVESGLKLFQNIIIAIGNNNKKKYLLHSDFRKKMITTLFKNNQRVHVVEYSGLTIEFCKQHNINHIIRGIRNCLDFNYEQGIAFSNQSINKNIDTIFIPSKKEYMFISSSVVKDLIIHKGELKKFIPETSIELINKYHQS